MPSFVVQSVKSICLSSCFARVFTHVKKTGEHFFLVSLYLRFFNQTKLFKGIRPNINNACRRGVKICGVSFGRLLAGDKATLINLTFLRLTPYRRREYERIPIFKMFALILVILTILEPFSEGRYKKSLRRTDRFSNLYVTDDMVIASAYCIPGLLAYQLNFCIFLQEIMQKVLDQFYTAGN